jgi:hypothetical protein
MSYVCQGKQFIREKDLKGVCGRPLRAKSFYGLTPQNKCEKDRTSRWVI